MKTLYELLGVSPDASDEALKTAYRKLAKMHHPDLNPDNPDATRRFRQVAAAISILCDAEQRAAYNQRLIRELQRTLDRERERRRLQFTAFLQKRLGRFVTSTAFARRGDAPAHGRRQPKETFCVKLAVRETSLEPQSYT